MSRDLAHLTLETQRGSKSAKRELLRSIAPVILSAARQVLHREDAEDVAQEAMLTFVRDLPTLRHPEATKAFAIRLTIRLALRARTKLHNETSKRERLARHEQVVGTTQDRTLMARQTVEELLARLDPLPENQRETLLLRYLADLSLEEVAQAMNVPTNTVRSRVRLARQALARQMELRERDTPTTRGAENKS